MSGTMTELKKSGRQRENYREQLHLAHKHLDEKIIEVQDLNNEIKKLKDLLDVSLMLSSKLIQQVL